MARRRRMIGTISAIFLTIAVVGVLMAVLPPLVFGAAEDDAAQVGEPFNQSLVGWGVAVLGLGGFVAALVRERRR